MNSPSVTFLIAARNAADTIGPAVESVINQDYDGDVQVVIVDDASTDETSRFIPQADNVKVLRNEQQMGRSLSRNKGLGSICTDLVAIQDADDISLPDRLSVTVPLVRNNKTVVGSQLVWQDARRGLYQGALWPTTGPEADRALEELRTPIAHPSMLIPVNLIREVGGYDERFPVGEDLELMLRLRRYHPEVRFMNADRPTVIYSRDEMDTFDYIFRASYWRHRVGLAHEVVPSSNFFWIRDAADRYVRQRVRYWRRRLKHVLGNSVK